MTQKAAAYKRKMLEIRHTLEKEKILTKDYQVLIPMCIELQINIS